MYRRILVAIDGSESSQRALEHALALAKDQQARLRIVNAVEFPHYLVMTTGYPVSVSDLMKSMREEGQRMLSQAQARASLVGAKTEAAVLESKTGAERTADILIEDAKQWDADLIVLGTHGRRGLDRVLLGSVAEAVVRLAPLPVLLVRAK